MIDIDKSLRQGKRRNPAGLVRGVYTKAEIEENNLINRQFKEQMTQHRLQKKAETRTDEKEKIVS